MPSGPTATTPPSEEELEESPSLSPPGRMIVQSRTEERCRASSPRFFLVKREKRFAKKGKRVRFRRG